MQAEDASIDSEPVAPLDVKMLLAIGIPGLQCLASRKISPLSGGNLVESSCILQRVSFHLQNPYSYYKDFTLRESGCQAWACRRLFLKTILDCLERFDLCGSVVKVARTISNLSEEVEPDKLLDYLQRMDNQSLVQRLGLILERLSKVQEIEGGLIEGIALQVGEHVYPLDPHEPEAGILDSRWRIRENIDTLGEL